MAVGVENADVIRQERYGLGGQRGGKSLDCLRGAGLNGEGFDRNAAGRCGCGNCGCYGGFAADLGGKSTLDVEVVGGSGGSGPVKGDFIACALGGEVFDELGKLQGWRMRRAGTGTADCHYEEQCGRSDDKALPVTKLRGRLHWLQAGILCALAFS